MTAPETTQAAAVTDAECRDRLRRILDVVRKYLPPDGITKDAALGEIIGLLDPWAIGFDVAVKPGDTSQDANDLDDMLVVRHLNPRAPGETLRQAIDRIINWEVMVNLDPAVCSTAQALVDKGRDEGLVSVIQVLNQNPYSLTKSECIHVVQGMRDLSRGAAKAIEAEHNSAADLADRMQGLADTPTASRYAEVLRKTCGAIAAHLRRLSAAESAAIDEKLGLVQLPPIRISKANHELLSRIAESQGLIIQAVVRDLLEPGETAGVKDLRQAKWLDPQCADRGACQSLVFKATPIDMVLHCPACGLQHIDSPDADDGQTVRDLGVERWTNPPHRSHLCHGCGHVWRPADVPTNGVAAVKTKGKIDSKIEKDSLRAWPTPDVVRSESPDFIRRTNEDYAAWCRAHYQPEALDDRGMQSLHGLWAWQEQERRFTAHPTKPFVHILREVNHRQELWLMHMVDGYMRPVGASGPIRMPDGWLVELDKHSGQNGGLKP